MENIFPTLIQIHHCRITDISHMPQVNQYQPDAEDKMRIPMIMINI